VRHPDGRVTSLDEAPREVLASVKNREFINGAIGTNLPVNTGPRVVNSGIPSSSMVGAPIQQSGITQPMITQPMMT